MSDAIDLTGAMADMGAAMEVFACMGKLASMAGVLGPIAGVAGLLLGLVMGGQDSEELAYMKEQFTEVRNKLDMISEELGNVLRAVEESTSRSLYAPVEENLKNQFRKYMEIISARSEYIEAEKQEFIDHFKDTKGDQNLHTLYDGIMGENFVFGVPILETAMISSKKNRRVMEQMCARLKSLFCIGLIALVGQTAITGNDVESIKKQWELKMGMVEAKMKAIVDRCTAEFLDQAKSDLEVLIKDNKVTSHSDQSFKYHQALAKKYYWIYWTVIVYDEVGGFEYHCTKGVNFFYFYRLKGINCVVSYSTSKTAIDRNTILRLMGDKRDCNDAREVVTLLTSKLPGYMVHAIRRFNGVYCMNNFPPQNIIFKTYDGVTLCVHSE